MRREQDPSGGYQNLESAWIRGILVLVGSVVVLRSSNHPESTGLSLRGKRAMVESIKVDFEGHVYLAVIVTGDSAPGMNPMGHEGQRSFYRAEDVKPLGSLKEECF